MLARPDIYYIPAKISNVPDYIRLDKALSLAVRVSILHNSWEDTYTELRETDILNDVTDYLMLVNPEHEVLTILALIGVPCYVLLDGYSYNQVYQILCKRYEEQHLLQYP